MKRMIGLLMMVGLVIGVVESGGDEDNPVKSNQDLLVGTWLDEDGDPFTFRSNGTFVDWDGDEGTWSLVGDQLTTTYDDPDYADFNSTDTISVTDTEFTVTDEDGERYVNTRQIGTAVISSTWGEMKASAHP